MLLWAALQNSAKAVPKSIWHGAAYVIGHGVTTEGCRQHFHKMHRELADEWDVATKDGPWRGPTPPPEIEIGKVDKDKWTSGREMVLEKGKTKEGFNGHTIVLETGKRLVDSNGDIIGNRVRDGDRFQGVVDIDNEDADVVMRVTDTWRAGYREEETVVEVHDADDGLLDKASAVKSPKSTDTHSKQKTSKQNRKRRA